jgi:hypothetical protein
MHRLILSLFLMMFMFLFPGPCGVYAAAPPDLQYGQMPFDKSVDEVLKMFKGADIREDNTPYIEAISDYVLERYFKGGLKKDPEKGPCFYPNVVKKYVVSYPTDSDIEYLTLYFEGFESPAKPYRLFMVKKNYRKPGVVVFNLSVLFDGWARRIEAMVGSEPVIHQGTFQKFDSSAHEYYSPAMVGVWDGGGTLVFLMVADSTEGALGPEIIYVSSKGLARYLNNCKFMSGGQAAEQ